VTQKETPSSGVVLVESEVLVVALVVGIIEQEIKLLIFTD
jgi:hypothetical protein